MRRSLRAQTDQRSRPGSSEDDAARRHRPVIAGYEGIGRGFLRDRAELRVDLADLTARDFLAETTRFGLHSWRQRRNP
jgi:hypothetical protein